MASDRDIAIADRFDAGETLQSIAGDYGITRQRVWYIIHKLGRKPRTEQRRERNTQIAAAIANEGLTARQAVARFGMRYNTLLLVASKQGVKVRRDRLRDAPDIVERAGRVLAGESVWSAAGKDRAIAARLAWYCKEHGIISRFKSRRPPSQTKKEPDIRGVVIADNLRDAAILNRGKAPASAIAAAHGCTRNAIIGHWYRLRMEGVLA